MTWGKHGVTPGYPASLPRLIIPQHSPVTPLEAEVTMVQKSQPWKKTPVTVLTQCRSLGNATGMFCCTNCKDTISKFETNILRKGTVWPQSQFLNACVCERFIYSYSAAGKYMDRSWEYFNRNYAITFLGIHKWDFRCSEILESSKISPDTI